MHTIYLHIRFVKGETKKVPGIFYRGLWGMKLDSGYFLCGVFRRIGEPPARVLRLETSHRDVPCLSCAFPALGFRPLRRTSGGFSPAPHRLPKKAGENFYYAFLGRGGKI